MGISIDWPTPDIFKTPVLLPKGSVVSVTAYYANTSPRPGGIRLTVSKSCVKEVSPSLR